jgi:zinc protease
MISDALALKSSHIHTMNETTKGRRNVAKAKAVVCMLGLMTGLLVAPIQAQHPDRSKPPELGPPPTLQLPRIQHSQLSNRLPVLLLEKHEVPLLQINLLVRVGATADPPQKSGLASLAARMLTEGAGTRNALQLADAIDFLGASLSASADQHTTVVALHTPLSKLDSALTLLADVALRPQFPSEELERARKELLTTLVQWHDEPRAIASVLFNETLYGSKHPYGIPEIGNEQSLRSFTTEDLKQFHEKYFHSNNATLMVEIGRAHV